MNGDCKGEYQLKIFIFKYSSKLYLKLFLVIILGRIEMSYTLYKSSFNWNHGKGDWCVINVRPFQNFPKKFSDTFFYKYFRYNFELYLKINILSWNSTRVVWWMVIVKENTINKLLDKRMNVIFGWSNTKVLLWIELIRPTFHDH